MVGGCSYGPCHQHIRDPHQRNNGRAVAEPFRNGKSPAKFLITQHGRHHLMLQRSTNGQSARRPKSKSTLGSVGIIPVVRDLQAKQQSSIHYLPSFSLRSPVGRSKPTVWRFLSHRLLRPQLPNFVVRSTQGVLKQKIICHFFDHHAHPKPISNW